MNKLESLDNLKLVINENEKIEDIEYLEFCRRVDEALEYLEKKS